MVRILVAAIAVVVATVVVVAVFMSDAMLERGEAPAEVASSQSEGATSAGEIVAEGVLPEAPSLPLAEESAGVASGQAAGAPASETAAPETTASETTASETTAPETTASETAVVTRVVRATAGGAEAVSESPSPPEPAAGETQTAALPDEPATEPAVAPVIPSFDVVRVETSGEAVIAGRAAPFATVILLNGELEIARVVADASGSWVIILAEPLDPGDHQLGLRAEGPDGLAVLSDTLVVVAVPAPDAAVAGLEPQGSETTAAEPGALAEAATVQTAAAPLAVLTSRDELGASRILQQPEGAGLRDHALLLHAVDYDADGYLVISGRAKPGARVIVYLDGVALGYAQADAEGNWQVKPASPVSAGLHELRIDEVDDDGAVLARVATGFSRAELAEGFPKDHFVIVQPGNSLWRIARRTYGAGVQYSVIYQANETQIQDPHLIFPGQIFVVPSVN